MSPAVAKKQPRATLVTAKPKVAIVEKPVQSISVERARELMGNCVALNVTLTRIGNRRRVSTSEVEVDVEDKSWIGVSKKLIDAEELDAIRTLDTEIRHYIELHSMPSMLKRGVYLVSLPAVKEVTERLKEYEDQRRELVEKLVSVYDRLVQEAKERLRGLFDPSDYLGVDYLRRAFKMRTNYFEFVTPVSLKQVNQELYARESEKWDETLREGLESINQLLLVEFSDFVNDLVDKMTPDVEGKRKVFRDSKIDTVRQFLATLTVRNLADNAALNELGQRASAILDGVDPEMLRLSRRARESVREGFTDIKKQLDTMIVDQPGRAIAFD